MATLFEKYFNASGSGNNLDRMNPEEIVDAIYCLCSAVEEGKLVQASPEIIELQENGEISVLHDEEFNYMYAAPEVILALSQADKRSGWFTVGVLSYFLIHGRSYYKDKDICLTSMVDLVRQGSSLISVQGAQEQAEDVPSLLNLAMECMTRWNVHRRQEGVKFVLQAVKKYTGYAEIHYICGDQEVAVSSCVISDRGMNCQAGTAVTGEDGGNYSVAESLRIPFRPGSHRYYVKVRQSAVVADRYERFLCVQQHPIPKKIKLLQLGDQAQARRIFVDRNKDVTFQFYLLTGDPVLKKTVSEEYKYHVRVPADPRAESSLLQVSYNPGTGCDITLYDSSGTRQLSDNTLHFDV